MKLGKLPLIGLGLVALALQGCSSMYSPARDKQGQATKNSWGKLDLSKETTRVSANLNVLLDEQLKTVDENAIVVRDASVLALATLRTVEIPPGKSRPATLMDAVVRMQTMGGITSKAFPCRDTADGWCTFNTVYQKWHAALRSESAAEESYRGARINAARFGVQLPAECATFLAKKDDMAKIFAEKPGMGAAVGGYEAVQKLCENLDAAQSQQREIGRGGAWLDAHNEAATARKALEEARAKTAKARDDAKAAKAEITKEDDAGRSTSAKAKTAAVKLKTAVELINKAGDVFSAEFIAEEKQDSLNAFFQSIEKAESDKEPAAGTGRAASAVILFTNFFDQTSGRFKPSENASLTGLTLQRRLAAVEQASYAKAIANLERRVQLKEQRAAMLKEQLERLMSADDLLGKSTTAQRQAPFLSLMVPKEQKPGVEGNEDVWLGMAYYLDANIRMQSINTKLSLQINALERAEAVDVAGANLSNWKTLIDANVEQLSTWASEGIRNEDIAAFFDAVTKLAIAVGVNK